MFILIFPCVFPPPLCDLSHFIQTSLARLCLSFFYLPNFVLVCISLSLTPIRPSHFNFFSSFLASCPSLHPYFTFIFLPFLRCLLLLFCLIYISRYNSAFVSLFMFLTVLYVHYLLPSSHVTTFVCFLPFLRLTSPIRLSSSGRGFRLSALASCSSF